MSDSTGCPSCDYGLWHEGHVCYTYDEWRENQRRHREEQARLRIVRGLPDDVTVYYYD